MTVVEALVKDIHRAHIATNDAPEEIWLARDLFALAVGECGGIGWTAFDMPIYSHRRRAIVLVTVRPMGAAA
jgi:hypothetical protein